MLLVEEVPLTNEPLGPVVKARMDRFMRAFTAVNRDSRHPRFPIAQDTQDRINQRVRMTLEGPPLYWVASLSAFRFSLVLGACKRLGIEPGDLANWFRREEGPPRTRFDLILSGV